MSIGTQVRVFRRKAHLTQSALGEMADIGRFQVIAIEGGARIVSSSELARLADALGVSSTDLLFEGSYPAAFAPEMSPAAKEAIDWFREYIEDATMMARLAEVGL